MDKSIIEQVRETTRAAAEQMKKNNIPKEEAVKRIGDYELVDSVYNADKRAEKSLERELRQRNEREEG